MLIVALIAFPQMKAADNNRVAKYHWGFFGDYNYTMHTTSNDGFTVYQHDELGHIIDIPLGYPWFEDGKGHGFSLGGLFEWNINETFALGGTLGYSLMKGKFYDDKCVQDVLLNGVLYDNIGSRHYFKPTISTINLTPYLTAKLYKGLYAKVGLNLGFVVSNSAKEYQELKYVRPDGDVWFVDSHERKSEEYDIDMDDAIEKFQIGLALGLGYEIPISDNGTLLVPEIKYNLGLTNVASDIGSPVFVDKTCDWKASNLSAGLAVKFPIFAKVADDNAPKTVLNKNYHLTADLKTYGVDIDGKHTLNPQFVIEEFETEEVFPLLANIYFTPGKSAVNDTRIRKLNDLDVSNFREEDLQADAIEINRDVINLIAYRMYDLPNTKVVITGYTNVDGEDTKNRNISMERANAVKAYMVQMWGISGDRIAVQEDKAARRSINSKSLNDYIQENAKASIAPANDVSNELFTPINKIYIDKVANPPMAEFNTEVTAEAGLDHYTLAVSQKDNPVIEFSGVSTSDVIPWTIKNVNLNEILDVILVAKDMAEQQVVVEDKIDVEYITLKSKRSKTDGDYKVDRYSLILFDYDKADVSPQDKAALQKIKTTIRSDAKVVISGYADRAGESAYNKRLAQKRCEEVNKILGVKNAEIKPYGNDVLVFDNTTPEGRALSRTVRVEVYTPVK